MNSKHLLLLIALAGVTVALRAQTAVITPPPAVTKLESGVIYSRGDYGLAEDTTVLVVPLTFSYEAGDWTWRISAPWLSIDGPANVIGDGAGGTAGRPVAKARQKVSHA